LEAKGFRLSRYKTEYMKYDFSKTLKRREMLDSMVRWYPRKTPSLFGIDATEGWGYR
jgi:hypothetical protein